MNKDVATKQIVNKLSPFKSIVQMLIIVFMMFCVVLVPLCCIDGFLEWQKRLADSNSPVVNGLIVNREPIIYKGIIPGAEFSIKVENEDTIIHAKTQRYLLEKVPDSVSFHYTGNPSREVCLLDYEENPFWEFLICLFATMLLLFLLMNLSLAKLKNRILNTERP